MKRRELKYKLETSCGALIWRANEGKLEVLLIQQKERSDMWCIPKGHKYPHEMFVETAIREVKEEIGLDISIGKRLVDSYTKNKRNRKRVISFLAQQDDPSQEISLDKREIRIATWFSFDEIKKLKIKPYQQEAIFFGLNLIKLIQDTQTLNFENNIELNQIELERLTEIAEAGADYINDWKHLKILLFRVLPLKSKQKFCQSFNEFEQAVISNWFSLTGKKLIINI